MALVVVVGFSTTAAAQTEKAPPNLVVLTIGVGQHKAAGRDLSNLEHAAKDARDLAVALKAQEGKLFTRVHMRTLTDTDATRQNIEEALDWLPKQVKATDYVMVFVSGHGAIDSLGHYFFVPHDFEPGRPRTGVRWTVFHDTLSRLPGKRFLILDTCRSGGAGGTGLATVPPTDLLKGLAEQAGLITYAACMAGESSFEPKGKGAIQNGFFTCALLEALSGKADSDRDDTITLAEVDAYVANRVKVLSKGRQNPTMQRPATIPSGLALALLRDTMPLAAGYPASSMPLTDLPPVVSNPPPTGPISPVATPVTVNRRPR